MNDRGDAWIGVPVGILSALLVVALFLNWSGATQLHEAGELAIKLAACGLVLVALAGVESSRRTLSRRIVLLVYAVAAVVSVVAYFNFGIFHGPNFRSPDHPQVVHEWEQFHYQLGSKYFPELGFDGLYAASFAAQQQSHPQRRLPRRFRDLRNNRITDTEALQTEMDRVAARFSPDRWQQFVSDNAHFMAGAQPPILNRIRKDHGYNPSPAWTAVARSFNRATPITQSSVLAMAQLDVLLLALAFALVFRAFGARIGCGALVLFGLGFAGRYAWTGGAFLRMDWFAAILAACCMFKRDRAFLAGLLIGYAASVRLFPAAFLFGPGVLALREITRGAVPWRFVRTMSGFVLMAVLAVAWSSTGARGFSAWTEFSQRMQAHQLSSGRNIVGLEQVAFFGSEILQQAVRTDRGEIWDLQREEIVRVRAERRVPYLAVQVAALLLLGAAVWGLPLWSATALSMLAIFVLSPAGGYYWVMTAAGALCGRRVFFATLAFNTSMYAVSLLEPDVLVRYGVMSWLMVAMFAVWVLPDAIRNLRADRDAGGPTADDVVA